MIGCFADTSFFIVMLFENDKARAELYDQRPDRGWSLTDCTSFVIMQHYGLRDALTGDHHFEQAGFNVLMR